jgi:hypothetical protein
MSLAAPAPVQPAESVAPLFNCRSNPARNVMSPPHHDSEHGCKLRVPPIWLLAGLRYEGKRQCGQWKRRKRGEWKSDAVSRAGLTSAATETGAPISTDCRICPRRSPLRLFVCPRKLGAIR